MTTAGREPASGRDALTAGRATAPDSAERMLGGRPGVPALGRGPAPAGDSAQAAYHHPAAGWGAAKSVSRVVARSGRPVATARALLKMNHGDGGFDCPGCAPIGDYSQQSAQPLMKHLRVEIVRSDSANAE